MDRKPSDWFARESLTAVPSEATPTPPWFERLETLRLVPDLDLNDRAIALAKTPAGKALLAALGAFSAYVWNQQAYIRPTGPWPEDVGWPWPWIGAAIGATSFLPGSRKVVLAVACLWMLATRFLTTSASWLVLVPYPLAFAYCLVARRWAKSPLFTHPVRTLVLGYCAALILFHPSPGGRVSAGWTVTLSFGAILWFVAYALQPRPASARGSLLLEVANFPRVWGSTFVPYPKGQAYLDRIEAKDATEQARVQLKGLKLLLWSGCLWLVLQAFSRPLRGPLPTSQALVAAWAHGKPFPWSISWLGLLFEQFAVVLDYTLQGHMFIAWCRLCGYNALRNTYKPMSSRSISDFYSRFYYYFKELLADFFFFPTYLAYFKKSQRLRMFVATFAAAGFGNFLYHFLRDIDRLQSNSFGQVLFAERAHAFYCLVLALGVAGSHLQNMSSGGRSKAPSQGSMVAPALVFLFFAVLGIFDTSDAPYAFTDYVGLTLHLFVPWTTHG